MEYLSGYKSYLQSRSYSPATIRNYLSDLNKFFLFASTASYSSSLETLLTSNAISDFLSQTSNDNNAKRYLATLRSFCQYALNQNLIAQNPLRSLASSTTSKDSQISTQDLIKQYRTYLLSKNKTPATIKNYINDIQNFIDWSQSFET